MPKIAEKYEKGKVPAGLETYYTVEKDGFMYAEFEDGVALATNAPLAAKNAELLKEKQTVQTKYDSLVTSSGDLARQVNELTAQIASGGQVSADELAIVTALKGIKDKTPAEIKKMVEEFPALQGQIDAFKTKEENDTIAQSMGWKPSVFGALRPVLAKDLSFEVVEVTENDKPVKKVMVSGKNAEGVDFKKSLADYVKENSGWTDHLPSLSATGEKGQEWVAQNQAGGGSQGAKSILDERIEKQNAAVAAKGTPFSPATPATPPASGS